MDIKSYPTEIEIELVPAFNDRPPDVCLQFDDDMHFRGPLTETGSFVITADESPGMHSISVTLENKTNRDAAQTVTISRITMCGISSDRFIWQAKYRPIYPEPWAYQQRQAGKVLEPIITNTTCLGWNGTWCLEFTVPVFTWIHQIKNLGWIYE